METRIDCPTRERMGRVTVIRPDGTLSTATCGNCNGEGFIMDHSPEGCAYCAHATVGALRAAPLF